ncbi:MAG: septum formation protein Maf [Bacteriovoracaceae bacterium]|nr:septum formation protein Maf [Bacteriovoracaceae bacterium]
MKNLQLVLASKSPRRFELLSHLGLKFVVRTTEVVEESACSSPEEVVVDLAILKGKSTLEHLMSVDQTSSPLVIAADTIVCLENEILGKPVDTNDARSILKKLSGRKHDVLTGVYLGTKEKRFHFFCKSSVWFDPIEDVILEQYLSTGDSLDKAGAYGIQGAGLLFISKLEGSYSNVVGLPLSDLILQLGKFLGTKDWRKLIE